MPRPGIILLAAGGSKRMGRPKQLLPWKGGTLLRFACETALKTLCRPVIVVLGCEADACQKAIFDLPVILVVNEEWQKGLGSSIGAGVAALEKESPDISGALFLLGDQPTVTPDFLESIVAHWNPSLWPIVATKYGTKGGVPALFDRAFFPQLRVLEHDQGARFLIDSEKQRTIRVEPGQSLIDLDTPEAYLNQLEHSRSGSILSRAQ